MYYFDMRHLRWAHISDGRPMHVSYTDVTGHAAWRMHDHDFCEVFWVDSGRGVHMLNDGRETLRAGHLSFVRAGDVHGFELAASSEPFAIVNVAFPHCAWRELASRYDLDGHPAFSSGGSRPPGLQLEGTLALQAGALFLGLLRAPRTALARDAFLLTLARLLDLRDPEIDIGAGAPAWLRRALLLALNRPELPVEGPAALARAAGCTGAHLSRTMKKHLGVAPSEWCQRRRIEHATLLLESTGYAVSEVAMEVGFHNLSHFHRCFRRVTGTTPRRYRERRHRTIV